MNTIAKFEFVSQEQFTNDWNDCFPEKENPFHELKLPRRATKGSAGYDFYSPVDFTLQPGEEIKFPTGIRAKIDSGWVLLMFPRSSLGFKYRLQLNNTVGVIDSDYYGAKNEGHIFVKLTNFGEKPVTIKSGDAVVQGVFLPFGIVENDDSGNTRIGGFGSTNVQ